MFSSIDPGGGWPENNGAGGEESCSDSVVDFLRQQ